MKILARCGIGAVALILIGVGLSTWALRAPQPAPAPPQGFGFLGVTLIEPGLSRRTHMRLHVDGSRIAAAEPESGSSDGPFARTFVLPGLTDTHAHMPFPGFPGDDAYTLLLLLSHGVTSVLLTGGTSPEVANALRTQIASGELSGPRIFTCGPILDGVDPVIPNARSVATPEEARSVVAELASRGVDCIKAYDRLDLETTRSLRAAAHAHGLPIIGHTPQALSFDQPQLDDLQHLRGAHPPFQGEDLRYPYFLAAWDRLDDAWLDHVIDVSLRQRIAHTPTLVATQGTVDARDWATWRNGPVMRLWLPQLRDGLWSAEVGFSPTRFMTDADFAMVTRATLQMRRTVRRLHEAGVPLHTGTDSNAPNIVPGASLQRELELFVEAGIPPEDALEYSTRISPTFLGVSGAGELRAGAPADFLIFREDPTRDLTALRTVEAVIQNGRLYTRADLDARLATYQAHYNGVAFQTLIMPPLRGGLRALSGWLARAR